MGITGSTNRGGINILTVSDLVERNRNRATSDNDSTTHLSLYADSTSSNNSTCNNEGPSQRNGCCKFPFSKFQLKNFERSFVLLGIGHVFLGIMSITCGIMVLFGGYIYWNNEIAVGVWCGATYLIPGVIGSLTSWGIGRKVCTAKIYAISAIIAGILSCLPIMWYFVFFEPIIQSCIPGQTCPKSMQVIAEVVLVVLSAAELIISMVTIGAVITSRISVRESENQETDPRADSRSRSLPLTLGEYWHSRPPFNIILPNDSPPPYTYDNMGFTEEENPTRRPASSQSISLIPLDPPPYSGEHFPCEEDNTSAERTEQDQTNSCDQNPPESASATIISCQLEKSIAQSVKASSEPDEKPNKTISPSPLSSSDESKAASPISVVLVDGEEDKSFESVCMKLEPDATDRQLDEQDNAANSLPLMKSSEPIPMVHRELDEEEKTMNNLSLTISSEPSSDRESNEEERAVLVKSSELNSDGLLDEQEKVVNNLPLTSIQLSLKPENSLEMISDSPNPEFESHNKEEKDDLLEDKMGEPCKENIKEENSNIEGSKLCDFSDQNQKEPGIDSDESLDKNEEPSTNSAFTKVDLGELSSKTSGEEKNNSNEISMQEEKSHQKSDEKCDKEPEKSIQQDFTEVSTPDLCISLNEPCCYLPSNSDLSKECIDTLDLELHDSMQIDSVKAEC